MICRLPTEAEWEYACRAGKPTKFWWGDKLEGAEMRINSDGKADGFEFISPADHFKSRGRNKFGLADMLGNVMELCLDKFDKAQAHEEVWTGNATSHVARGGAFRSTPGDVRCASRMWIRTSATDIGAQANVGFRVCCALAR